MQNAGVRDRVQRLLEQHGTNERMLDAYWQWATNPTPPSAGYALEENCGFINTNLLVRYGEPAIDIVSQLAGECRELRADASVYDLQQAVISVLNGPVGQGLRDAVLNRLNEEKPTRRALAAWLANRSRWCTRPGGDAWVGGEYDWSLGMDLDAAGRDTETQLFRSLFGMEAAHCDMPREALLVGVINRLFYRNILGHMQPKVRPGPRIPLAKIVY
jgi:hypothetical protein